MHTCPECGQACYCNGDIDDHDNGPYAAVECEHFLECSAENLDADDETE